MQILTITLSPSFLNPFLFPKPIAESSSMCELIIQATAAKQEELQEQTLGQEQEWLTRVSSEGSWPRNTASVHSGRVMVAAAAAASPTGWLTVGKIIILNHLKEILVNSYKD